MQALIAFYSRTGNTRKAAELIAALLEKAGAEVTLETIIDRKNRSGILGWLGAGRDSMLERQADIEPLRADPGDFDLVLAGGPVWAGRLSPPVRAFLKRSGETIDRAAFFCTMQGVDPARTFDAMKKTLGKPPLATLALRQKFVRTEDEREYLAKVRSFVASLKSLL